MCQDGLITTTCTPWEADSSLSTPGASSSHSGSKLRYTAYETPSSLSRIRRPASVARAASSSRSTNSLDHIEGLRPDSSLSARCVKSDDGLVLTLTPGELALVSGSPKLRASGLVSRCPIQVSSNSSFLISSSIRGVNRCRPGGPNSRTFWYDNLESHYV